MKSVSIGIMSDLHLDRSDGKIDLHKEMLQNDFIILAGDTSIGSPSVEFANSLGIPVVKILGNHEYRGKNLSYEAGRLKKLAGPDTHILEKNAIIMKGVRVIGATLWSNYKLKGVRAQKNMASKKEGGLVDMQNVVVGSQHRPIKPKDLIENHKSSVAYIESVLKEEFDGPTIIISHHGPHSLSIGEKYKDTPLVPTYVSDLEALILNYQPEFWIHGHLHNSSDYLIGNTRVICNPRGNMANDPNPDFNNNLSIKPFKSR